MIEYLKLFLIAIVLGFIQSFILQEIDMGVWLRPMPYILVFLISPVNSNKFLVLAFAFIFGTFIDLLSGSYGTHAASSIVMVFIKNYIDKRWVDFDSLKLQGKTYLGTQTKGWTYYTYYTFSIIFVHHLSFFLLDYFELNSIFQMLFSTLVSSIGTFLMILLLKSVFRR